MDTEQLKMLLETFAQMGEAGKAAFVWWLVISELIPTVAFSACFIAFAKGGYSLLQRVIETPDGSFRGNFIESFAQVMGIKEEGFGITKRQALAALRKVAEMRERIAELERELES